MPWAGTPISTWWPRRRSTRQWKRATPTWRGTPNATASTSPIRWLDALQRRWRLVGGYHQEMRIGCGDRLGPVVLPSLGEDVDHAPSLLRHLGRGDDVDRPRRAQVVDGDVDDLGYRLGLGLPQQMEDRRHLQHGAQSAAMDRRQEGVADQVIVIAHAGQQLAGAVLRRDAHPARIGDRLGEPCDLARFARFGQALEQRAHDLVSRTIARSEEPRLNSS